MNGRPISDDDLHAYVDGRIDAARIAEIEAYLATHPDIAARIAADRRLREDLRAAFVPIADEPIPSELNPARLIERRRRPAGRSWRDAAAAVVLLTAGLAGGWSLHGGVQPSSEGVAALAGEAVASYRSFAPDRVRPVEFGAADSRRLVDWASDRLRLPLAIPDLHSFHFRLMGGRLVATSHGPAVMLMYDDDRGTRLVMITRPMAADRDARMSESRNGDLTGFSWAADGVGISVVGPVAPDTLHPIADAVRRQI